MFFAELLCEEQEGEAEAEADTEAEAATKVIGITNKSLCAGVLQKAISAVSSFRLEHRDHNFRLWMALPDVFGQVNHSLPEG